MRKRIIAITSLLSLLVLVGQFCAKDKEPDDPYEGLTELEIIEQFPESY